MHLTDELKLTGGEPSAQRGPMAWWPSTLMMLIGPSTKTHGNTSNNANTCQPCQMRGLLSGVPQHPRDKIWKSWNAHLLVASEFKNKNYSQILVQTPAVLQNPMFFSCWNPSYLLHIERTSTKSPNETHPGQTHRPWFFQGAEVISTWQLHISTMIKRCEEPSSDDFIE